MPAPFEILAVSEAVMARDLLVFDPRKGSGSWLGGGLAGWAVFVRFGLCLSWILVVAAPISERKAQPDSRVSAVFELLHRDSTRTSTSS